MKDELNNQGDRRRKAIQILRLTVKIFNFDLLKIRNLMFPELTAYFQQA